MKQNYSELPSGYFETIQKSITGVFRFRIQQIQRMG